MPSHFKGEATNHQDRWSSTNKCNCGCLPLRAQQKYLSQWIKLPPWAKRLPNWGSPYMTSTYFLTFWSSSPFQSAIYQHYLSANWDALFDPSSPFLADVTYGSPLSTTHAAHSLAVSVKSAKGRKDTFTFFAKFCPSSPFPSLLSFFPLQFSQSHRRMRRARWAAGESRSGSVNSPPICNSPVV